MFYFRPKKRSFFEKIFLYPKREFYKIKFYLLSHAIYFFRIFFVNNKIKKNKISILLPSKFRSKKFLRLIKSIYKLTHFIERINIMVLLDKNEKEKKLYEKYKKFFLKKNFKINIFYKNLKNHCSRNNYLAKKKDSDLYFLMNDDAIFIKKNWDTYIDFIVSKLNDEKPFVIFVKTIGHKDAYYIHSDFPIINRKWLKALGYVGNHYTSGMIDAWINELGLLSGRYMITLENIATHLNFRLINEKEDETSRKLLISQKNDWDIWENTKGKRLNHSKKIKLF